MRRWNGILALVVAAGATALGARTLVAAPAAARARGPQVVVTPHASVASSKREREPGLAAPWAAALSPLPVVNGSRSEARGRIRLYDDRGALDRAAACAFMRVASRHGPSEHPPSPGTEGASDDCGDALDVRLVQLVARAAYHFGGKAVTVVSAVRPGARGRHGSGEALDFKLDGVAASALASYLRTLPRAGVGFYSHRRTQYVHLDVREDSYHWLDGSPPGVTWRERRLGDPKQRARDAAYAPLMDLPEPPKPEPSKPEPPRPPKR